MTSNYKFFRQSVIVHDSLEPSSQTKEVNDFHANHRDFLKSALESIHAQSTRDAKYRQARALIAARPDIVEAFSRLVHGERALNPMPPTTGALNFVKSKVKSSADTSVLDFAAGAGEKARLIWPNSMVYAFDRVPRKDEYRDKAARNKALAALEPPTWVGRALNISPHVILAFNATIHVHPRSTAHILEVRPHLPSLVASGCANVSGTDGIITTLYRDEIRTEIWKKPISQNHVINNNHTYSFIIKPFTINYIAGKLVEGKKPSFEKKIRPLCDSAGELIRITPKHDGTLHQIILTQDGKITDYNVETGKTYIRETDCEGHTMEFETENTKDGVYFVRIIRLDTVHGTLIHPDEYHKITGPWIHNANLDGESEEGFIVHFLDQKGYQQAYHKHEWTYDLDAEHHLNFFQTTKGCDTRICTYNALGEHLRCRPMKVRSDDNTTMRAQLRETTLLRESLIRQKYVYLDKNRTPTMKHKARYKLSGEEARKQYDCVSKSVTLRTGYYDTVGDDTYTRQTNTEIIMGYTAKNAINILSHKQLASMFLHYQETQAGKGDEDLEDIMDHYFELGADAAEEALRYGESDTISIRTTRSMLMSFLNNGGKLKHNKEGDVVVTLAPDGNRTTITNIHLPVGLAYVRTHLAYEDGPGLYSQPPGKARQGNYSTTLGVCIKGFEMADNTIVKSSPTPAARNASGNYIAFFGKASPFSNFHPCNIDGKATTVEAHYQYAKVKAVGVDIPEILDMEPTAAKKEGSKYKPPAHIRINIMTELVLKKFTQNPHLRSRLLETEDKMLIEANTHDDFFGAGLSTGAITDPNNLPGSNHLGKILESVRTSIRVREHLK